MDTYSSGIYDTTPIFPGMKQKTGVYLVGPQNLK